MISMDRTHRAVLRPSNVLWHSNKTSLLVCHSATVAVHVGLQMADTCPDTMIVRLQTAFLKTTKGTNASAAVFGVADRAEPSS